MVSPTRNIPFMTAISFTFTANFAAAEIDMAMYNNISHLLYSVCSPVFSMAFVVLNILSIVIFIKKFKLASLSLVVMVNICLCDIAVCLISNNFYVINLIHPTYAWATGPVACKLFKTLTMTCNLCQIFSFVVLCLDRMRRLIAPTNPQWQKKHGISFLVLVWTLSLSITGPRFVLFDEKVITKWNSETNTTKIVNFACKPIGINTLGYAIMTILQFVAGYMIPMITIIVNIGVCEYNIRKHAVFISRKVGNSYTMKMNRQLANVFNLTALLFMSIWTPFFVMSILDLKMNLVGNKELTHLNFAFRCTLLVVGSGKPLIYMIALRRFRNAMCGNLCTPTSDVRSDESSTGSTTRGSTRHYRTNFTNQSSEVTNSCEKADNFSNIE